MSSGNPLIGKKTISLLLKVAVANSAKTAKIVAVLP